MAVATVVNGWLQPVFTAMALEDNIPETVAHCDLSRLFEFLQINVWSKLSQFRSN